MARSLSPADLDPLDSAASDITPDPSVGRRRYARHRELVASGMSEEQAADAMLAEDRAALSPAPAAVDDGLRQAVGRGSLYPEEAALVAREAETEQSAAELGMPEQRALPPHWREAAAGNDMVGRFRFVHSPTGLRAVDTSPTPADRQAQFMRWANSEPGSETQARYNPAGAAEWDAKVAGQISKWAQDDLAISADPVLSAQRKAAEQAAFQDRIARRDFLENDPRTQKIRGDRLADLARRESNRRLMQQNPFLTLNDPTASDLQKQVIVDTYFRNPQNDADPRVQVARMEAEARAAERKAALDTQMKMAEDDRTFRAGEGDKTREEAQAARAQEMQQFLTKLEQDRLASERTSAERLQQFQAQMQAASQQHAATMAGFQAQLEAARTNAGATVDVAEITSAVRREALAEERDRGERALALTDKNRQRDELVLQYGPGVEHLMSGDYGTPQAQAALQKIATASDKGYWGFWKADAERMDAVLHRLGITDPAMRQSLVEEYGLAYANRGKGRGQSLSTWFHGTPNYLPAPLK